jgi:hypothetical protein
MREHRRMRPSFESPRYLLLGACLLGCGSRSSLSTDALPASGTGGGGATTTDTGTTTTETTGGTSSTTTPTSTDACAGKPWTRTFAGGSYVLAHSVSADAAGDALVLGTFGTTVTVGTETFSGNDDFFLTRLDGCGNPIWQKKIGHVGPGEVLIGRAVFDPSGNVLFAGTIEGLASIDGVELPTLGGRDVVVAKFDPSGELLWAQRWGDAGHQEMSALLALPDGNLVVGGNFVGTLQIGDKTAASTVPYNVFVAELSPDGAPVADIFHFQGDMGAGLYSMASTPGGVAIGLQYLGQPVVPFLPETSTLDLAVLLVKDGAGVPLGTIHGGGDKYPTGLAVHPGTGRLIVTASSSAMTGMSSTPTTAAATPASRSRTGYWRTRAGRTPTSSLEVGVSLAPSSWTLSRAARTSRASSRERSTSPARASSRPPRRSTHSWPASSRRTPLFST